MNRRELNAQQEQIINNPQNIFVTACPGSGKTRVLTYRIIKELSALESTKHKVVALTFTNRAADEIKTRLSSEEIQLDSLWAGTIHSFALQWIIRPYACYCDRLKTGFSLADEYYSEKVINELKKKYGLRPFDMVNTRHDRNGIIEVNSEIEDIICREYHDHLEKRKLIDYDLLLYLAYDLISKNLEISKTLGSIMRLICVDEYQDTQDLQYGILSYIVKNSIGFTKIFIVGDPDQAIYTSLGGVAKTCDEIKNEFEVDEISHCELSGNYRSTQRIINFYLNFQGNKFYIESLTDYADEMGLITFSNQNYHKDDLPKIIAHLIKMHLNNGIMEHEICVVAPRWQLIIQMGRKLVSLLPGVKFDAPGLSPFSRQRDNIWFKITRLFLTQPEPNMYITRLRWAKEILLELEYMIGREIEEYQTPRKLLRLINSIHSAHVEGIPYIEDVFKKFIKGLNINLDGHPSLNEAMISFLDGAKSRLDNKEYKVPSDVHSLKSMFKRPNGIVVNTCHGIKGEEYNTVICFGLLKGYIPHWENIFNRNCDDNYEARKLLYVIASRAKKNLHLIAEYGRNTTRGNAYETNIQLENLRYPYDTH